MKTTTNVGQAASLPRRADASVNVRGARPGGCGLFSAFRVAADGLADRLTFSQVSRTVWIAFLLCALCLGCVTGGRIRPPEPPPMPLRPVLRPTNDLPAETIRLPFGTNSVTLFLPAGWRSAPPDRLAIHFHTADWFVFGEHWRAGYRFPLLSVMLGSGSAKYRAPFVEPAVFPELIRRVESELRQRGVPGAEVRDVDIASFSAGYGAVRELVQQPAARQLIRRIVLSDSLYAGLSSGANGLGPRAVQADQIECWLPFAREAVAGRKTFVLSHSQIPTPAYASTAECAAALLAALKLETKPASSVAAGVAGEFPLLTRCDAGRFHVWSYAGTNANAHLVHPRNLAEVWRELDDADQ